MNADVGINRWWQTEGEKLKSRRALCLFVFAFVLLAACAPAPTAIPTTAAPATSTPQPVFITATPWIVTATSESTATSSPTPAATATPTMVPGDFKGVNWPGNSYSVVDAGKIANLAGINGSTSVLDIEYVQGNNTFNVAVTGDVTSDPSWQKYYNDNYSPGNARSLDDLLSNANRYGFAFGVRAEVAGYLRYVNANIDHSLDAQFAGIASNPQFAGHLDKIYVTVGLADGKVRVTELKDNKTGQVYSVDARGNIVEAAAVATATPAPSFEQLYSNLPIIDKIIPATINNTGDEFRQGGELISRYETDPYYNLIRENLGLPNSQVLVATPNITEIPTNYRIQSGITGEFKQPFSLFFPFKVTIPSPIFYVNHQLLT